MTHSKILSRNRGRAGFSLVELVITLAIVALLTSIAVPSFNKYVSKTRRADGMSELSRIMQRQEKYFINNLAYSTNFKDLGLAIADDELESESGHYMIKAEACAGSTIARCVILTASPQETQQEDGWLSLTSRGERDWERNAMGETGWP